MQLVKLVVELSNHLLNVLRLLLLVELVDHSLLQVHLSEAHDLALRAYVQLLLDLLHDDWLAHYRLDVRVLVHLQHADVPVVDVVY